MDIKNHVYIWVTDIKSCIEGKYILDGRPFDDGFGFGNEDVRSYAGNILLVTDKETINKKGEIGLTHISRQGTLWTFESDYLPEPPFLLTSNMLIKHKYSGTMSLEPSDEAQEVFNRYSKQIYPVVSADFLGIITYSSNCIWLDAFSEVTGNILTKEEIIFFSEWDVKAGTIKII